ncbi:hypothetical protein EYF80_044664 [Liparis tanakae]|uniref:Uncharacterized protein n=1 Tax=Liparis tanakae TaxID=230148 RepID=A0A4Z2FW62_9TELE|nr:hypothetical protein EYF80_044664 [Liparis tanakae]
MATASSSTVAMRHHGNSKHRATDGVVLWKEFSSEERRAAKKEIQSRSCDRSGVRGGPMTPSAAYPFVAVDSLNERIIPAGAVVHGLQRTARSWQLLERALAAMRWLLRATSRSRKRRAFWERLSWRLWAEPPRRTASASSLRRRIWRITPSNSSVTLCCRDADVSMNLQSNTTAHARPSGKKTKRHIDLSRIHQVLPCAP